MNLARTSCISHRFSLSGVNGLKMLGVVHDAVVFLLEQLYGARHCRNYRFRFHKPEESEDPPVNPHGSARAEVYHRCVSWPGWSVFILAIPENPKPFYNGECKVMIVNTLIDFYRLDKIFRRSVLDMFNFLASKHRQPPVYNPREEDEEEMLQKSAR